MSDLPITTVIRVSVSAPSVGLGPFNTGLILLLTTETPDPVFTDDYKVYQESASVEQDFGTDSETYNIALGVFNQSPNILTAGGALIIAPLEPSETLQEGILRMKGIVPFFGILSSQIEADADVLDAADSVQGANNVLAIVQRDPAVLEPDGLFDQLKDGSYRKTRPLYYGAPDAGAATRALRMAGAYLSRLLSVNYGGSNTTLNMNLKTLVSVLPDETMDLTLYTKAQEVGADIYPSIEGVPKVLSSGANGFADQVTNAGWLQAAISIAGFNYLAQVQTKIPQTPEGMDGLVGAYREVLKQAVTNGFIAPGTWTDPTTFGNPEDLKANIEQFGYYIYYVPLSQQSQVDRAARTAPLVQIAAKEAGAFNNGNILIILNP